MRFQRVALLSMLLTACRPQAPLPALDIATTTSVQNSGLLDTVLPHFREATVRVHAAGSGRALEMLANGTARLVISHAPEAEARYLREHRDWRYRKLAFNWFVIVGPRDDPASVTSASGAAEAFRRIAASKTAFVSRGDESGTHERERALWEAAGIRPPADRLIVSGRGMALALRHADELNAYTLSDEATFWQLQRQLELLELFAADPLLLNTYAVLHREGDAAAGALADWLTSADGRDRIRAFQVEGRQAFSIWPPGCPTETPDALPCGVQRR